MKSLARRTVTVLGVHDGHDAGAALVRDGRVLAALQEERPRSIDRSRYAAKFEV